MNLSRIVSGGQTGVDRGALDAALEAGFPCGGWCPPGRMAEDGPIPQHYPLIELTRGGYRERTLQNVLDSDGTLVIAFGPPTGGTRLTIRSCTRNCKPYKLVNAEIAEPAQAAALAAKFVSDNGVRILNVAGPRASGKPGAYDYTRQAVTLLLDQAAQPSK